MPDHESSNDIVEEQLNERLGQIEEVLQRDVLGFKGIIVFGVDDAIRDAIEALPQKKDGLAVIIETPGGYVEVTQRIVDCLRFHYQHVEFIVPNFAMSAGTILVMSGDTIHMDYYSVLGPIDPQSKQPQTDRLIPALGYLEWYTRLVDKSRSPEGLSDAELAFLLNKFDPAELYQFEQQRELSITLLRDWLAKYKFKDWTETETQKLPVTDELRQERAGEIAAKLNDTSRWHIHSRGISMEVLRRELRLRISDLEDNSDLKEAVRSYYRLLKGFLVKLGCGDVVHTRQDFLQL